MAIVQQARKRGAFKRPDISQFVPKGMEDTVARIAAAGQKVMYSPNMRDELLAEVQREAPVVQKMAESVTGLMLTLDSQMQGGIPQEALFPAALDLLGEAAEVLSQNGSPVTLDEYNEAALLMYVLIAKKLGISDEEVMGAAAQAAGVKPDEVADEEGDAEDAMPPDDEAAAMQEGFQ